MRQIILASTSPRRKELLKQLIGDNFKVVSSDYEEDHTLKLVADTLAETLSRGKAEAVARITKEKDAIIIAADTLGELEGNILGKPHTSANAKRMLRMMSGKVLDVVTGLTLIDLSCGRIIAEHEKTRVWIKKLTQSEIDAYVATGEPIDRGAGFAIQEKGAFLVERIDGDYFNVVGLPLFRLSKMLAEVGVDIFEYK